MITMEIVILILCLIGSAFFAGIETGVISINRLRLRHLVRRNVPGAKILQDFLMKPDNLIGTTLVGTNLLHVASSIMAASLGAHLMGAAGAWVMGIALTLVILVACEYLPKAWFQSFPASRTLPFARLLQYSYTIFYPISKTVTSIIKLLVPDPPLEKQNAQAFISREELIHLAHEGERSGVLTPDEHRMIHGVFELKTKPCGEIMIPRDKILHVQTDTPIEQLLDIARRSEHNRFPVLQADRQTFVGIIHIFDVLADTNSAGKTVKDYMRPVQLVADHTPVDHVLPRMRVTRQPMVLVTDERFEVIGLATLEDVLEEIVGKL
ncbi:MAG: hemolysin family protein [Lentisphaerota bacterium]